MSGGGSPSNVTQTSVTKLPDWLNNANQFGATQAQNLYNTGGPAYYPGNTVAPFSPMQEQAFTGVENMATQGDPNTNAGSTYIQNVLNGQFAASTANPYLNQTFTQAADAVQNQIGSEFEGAGRNPQASIGAQADQMNQLANDIYGGQYANSMNQMNSAAGMAPTYDQADVMNLSNLGITGAQLQQQAQAMQNANQTLYDYNAQLPYTNLSNYMNQVNSLAHGGTNSSTQPYFNNSGGAMGALGGAAAGAGIGSALVTAGAVNSWNPVGWGLMGAGALLGSGVL